MRPTTEQIQIAAYHRWEARWYAHGQHQRDWFEAEQSLLFEQNYTVSHLSCGDVIPKRHSGTICRFCEQAAPRCTFGAAQPWLPANVDRWGFATADICDECHALFQDTHDVATSEFLRSVDQDRFAATLPRDAYRGLIKAALAVAPRRLLEIAQDTIEWVQNTFADDDLDRMRTVDPVFHAAREPFQSPWFGLARRHDQHGPYPTLIAFFGADSWTIELALPLIALDDDLDGEPIEMPRVPWFDPSTPWPQTLRTRTLPVETRRARRRAALALSCA